MNKKRVLVVAENHNLASGFGIYAKNLLRRLHESGKYELAEFSIYAPSSMGKDVPWTFYGNAPEENDPKEDKDKYSANTVAQFGQWRFDKVCLDFRPDIVLTYRDPWMDMFISKSPCRKYFHWVWMPTVDSAPQKQSWMEGFANTDGIICYTDFGLRTLKNDAKSILNLVGCAPPGINTDIYKEYDKTELRESLGIKGDVNIIGTVMRNQKRKLFPEIIKTFGRFLKEAPEEIRNNTFLYLHTSYPEKQGWNLGYLVSEYGVAGRVLTTYVCKSCKEWHVSFFNDALSFCPHCKTVSCVMPSVSLGLSDEELVKVYSLFDLYVQYAICEGFGMPQVEAAACGVPVAATDYSAMEDVVRNTKGYPIRVKKFYRELETNAERAYPDNDHLLEVMINHLMQSKEEKEKQRKEVREATLNKYQWKDTLKIWEDYIDSYVPVGKQGQWNSPPEVHNLPSEIPEGLSNEQFVEWLHVAVLNEPRDTFKYEGVKLLRDLNFGAIVDQGVLEPINRDQVFQTFLNRAKNKITCEMIRCGMATMKEEDFINETRKNSGRNL